MTRPLNLALINANVITVDADFSIGEAIWVKDGLIRAVGKTDTVTAGLEAETRIVDVHGATIMPGFIDTHGHLGLFGLDTLKVDLDGALSRDSILERIKRAVTTAAPGDWIIANPVGTPPYFLDFEAIRARGELPERKELDAIAPDNPVYVLAPTNRVPNSALMNSAALQRAGIDATTATNAPIEIIKDERGELTGELRGAMQPLYNPYPFYQKIAEVLPPLTYDEVREGIRRLAPEFVRGGTTTLLEAHLTHPQELRAYGELLNNQELPLRVFFTFEIDVGMSRDAAENFVAAVRFAAGDGFGNARLKVVGISVGLDGPYWHGAACNDKPYRGPFGDLVDPGTLNSAETYRDVVELALRHDLRLHTECAGRGSIELAVNTLAAANERVDITDKRFVLEHVEFPTSEQIKACRELGLVPTTSTNFIWGKGAEVYQARLGAEYAERAIPLRDWLDAGVPICQSTDWGPRSAMFTLWQSLKRYAGLTQEVVGPGQRISREEAIRIFTVNGAYALNMENEIGSLQTGNRADLIVVNADPLTCAEDDIREISVLATMLDGNFVHQDAASPTQSI